MSKNQRLLQATPAAVWRVLADGWLYSSWVVGAARVRAVDAHWPAEGATIAHSFGTWPLLIDDTTTVLKSVPNEVMQLRARGWPAGEAEVLLEIAPAPGGCTVSLYEDAVSGPGRLVPKLVRTPILHWRNVETLRRLAMLAEGRTDPAEAGPPPGAPETLDAVLDHTEKIAQMAEAERVLPED